MNFSPDSVPIQLFRTFSPVADCEDAGEDWNDYFSSARERLKWDDLRDKSLVVVLGQAGIGKSIEFELEVQRLRNAGKPAFVVALNQLVEANSWGRALVDAIELYERWRASNETAYFFLDAVDEARLTGPSAFVRALSEVRFGLRDCMARARFVISSRPADWSIDGVSAAVDKYLSKPIATALSALTEIPEPPTGTGLRTVKVIQSRKAEPIEAQVVNLDPLAISEAKRLADAFGVRDAIAFWDAVSDGGYAFMATRPLDLGWMVDLWNEQRTFGTYRELIDFNVKNRLTEVNQSYLDAGVVLSADRMRVGAEELAAAAELSGRAYIATGYGPSVQINEVAPASVLSDWQPNEVERLLASAVFDEATFGRVRFHHRTTRAYLAACWVNRQLAAVPFHVVKPLFATSPFGTLVLIPARRWALSWLAAICVEAREWVARQFPEMLVFDGDPQEWDSASADQAFGAYVQRLRADLRKDWDNDEAEFRRVGRRLSPRLVAGLLATPALPSRVSTELLHVVKYGHLTDCTRVVFGIYRNTGTNQRTRQHALDVLVTIASSEQRLAIKEDLVLGRLTSDELVAAALSVIDWQGLGIAQLVTVFLTTKTEDRYRGGPMAQAIKGELLPTATASSAEMLLLAVLQALPMPDTGQRFSRTLSSDLPDRAWLLDVLPDCFERLLILLPRTGNDYPKACIEAAERIEAMRDSGFTERDEFKRLFTLIAAHPWLRWQVALEIALSESIRHSINRLTWGSTSLVRFEAADLSDLIMRANDMDAGEDARSIWFSVALDVASRELKGRVRVHAFAALATGPEVEARRQRIAEQRVSILNSVKQRRQWNADRVAQANERALQRRTNRAKLASEVDHIRSADHRGSLNWLIHHSYNHSDHKGFTRVDFGVIAKDFSQTVADALAVGLKVVWATAETPNPADFKDGVVPWDALTALAGLHALLSEGVEIASLTNAEAARAAKLAVWEFERTAKLVRALGNGAWSHCFGSALAMDGK